MANKNLAEKLTAAYQAAHAEADIGVRLLALEQLEKDISKQANPVVEVKRGNMATLFKGVGIGAVICGTVTAIATGDPGAIALATAGGGIPGVFGGIIYDGIAPDIINRKRQKKQQEYMLENIIPHEGFINKLKQQITEDKAVIMSVENAEEMRQSSKVKDVLINHPDLIEIFRSAQKAKPVADIPRFAANNNTAADKDQKTDVGFKL